MDSFKITNQQSSLMTTSLVLLKLEKDLSNPTESSTFLTDFRVFPGVDAKQTN